MIGERRFSFSCQYADDHNANPQFIEFCKQNTPFSSGRAIDLSWVAFDERVVRKLVPPVSCRLPLLLTLNLVTPDALAVNRSPLFILLTINDALLPIPPLIDNGAGVVAEPTNTLVSKSLANTKLPVPFGLRVRLSLDSVPIVAALPAPRLNTVALTPRVEDEVNVVRPVAVSVVSVLSNTITLFPEFSVRSVALPETNVNAPVAVSVVDAPSNAMFVSAI